MWRSWECPTMKWEMEIVAVLVANNQITEEKNVATAK